MSANNKQDFKLPKKWTFAEFREITCRGTFSKSGETIYEGRIPFDNDLVEIEFVYEGDVVKGFWEGQGKMVFKDGNIYEGEFAKDKRHGNGVFTSAKEEFIFEGTWKEGKIHGLCKQLFSSGTVNLSNYKEGKLHGICNSTRWYGLTTTQTYENGELKQSELTRKIKKEDFKKNPSETDMQFITNLLVECKKIITTNLIMN